MTENAWDDDAPTDASESHPIVPPAPRPVPATGVWVGPYEEPARYERLEHVGGGAEGAVFRARFVGLGTTSTREVALKEYHRPPGAPRNWPHDGTWLRIADQAGLLAGLADHRNLVRVQGIFLGAISSRATDRRPSGTDKVFETPYVVMEWIEGRSPAAEMAARTVPLDERLSWVCDLANAVDLLHSVSRTAGNPIVHGDIKPGNCLITPSCGLVLVDTGTLTRRDDIEAGRGLCSPPYAAPEVMAAPGRARGVAADLYSIGALAFLLVTGEPPPKADSAQFHSLIRERLESDGVAQIPAGRRAAVRDLLLAYLDLDPAVRERTGPVAWSTALRDHARPPAPRRRRTVSVSVATALAATATVVGLLLGPLTPGRPDGSPATSSPARRLTGPGLITSTRDFVPFGLHWAPFPTLATGDSLYITPPLGENIYAHLWGFHLPLDHCASAVEMDLRMKPAAGVSDYGVSVAPRSTLDDDQPTGASVQYESEGKDITDRPGFYVRPVDLPGGAWAMKVLPVPAPDLRLPHRLRVETQGTTLRAIIDGKRLPEFDAASVECGGVSIRVWGATAELTNVHVTGT